MRYFYGADFKGVYANKRVKVEVEWDYADYIQHKHPVDFADIIVVATFDPIPASLKEKLPPVAINVDREQVIHWANPKINTKKEDEYHSYPWRRLSRSVLDLFAYYQKQKGSTADFIGASLALSMFKSQKHCGFLFAPDGKEESFEGSPTDKAAWDFWLVSGHLPFIYRSEQKRVIRVKVLIPNLLLSYRFQAQF